MCNVAYGINESTLISSATGPQYATPLLPLTTCLSDVFNLLNGLASWRSTRDNKGFPTCGCRPQHWRLRVERSTRGRLMNGSCSFHFDCFLLRVSHTSCHNNLYLYTIEWHVLADVPCPLHQRTKTLPNPLPTNLEPQSGWTSLYQCDSSGAAGSFTQQDNITGFPRPWAEPITCSIPAPAFAISPKSAVRAVQSAPHNALEFIASAQAEAARLRYEANQNLAGWKHSSLDSQRSNLCMCFLSRLSGYQDVSAWRGSHWQYR